MKIGYIIRIVNQNMIKFQNHIILFNRNPKYAGIVYIIDKIIESMIFSTRSPFKITFYWVTLYMDIVTTIYSKYSVNVFCHCLDHLLSFLTPTSREFFYVSTHQTSYGFE